MDLSRLVYNFHAYCGKRNWRTGDPTDLGTCVARVFAIIALRETERPGQASPAEPSGPPLFMSEFGASGDPALIGAVTAEADRQLLSWAYWAWTYNDDPTGSSDEALVGPDGQLKATAADLAETYPEAVAGTPLSMAFDPSTRAFSMTFLADPRISAPTLIAVPALQYPIGYCAAASVGTSSPGPTRACSRSRTREPPDRLL